MTSGVRLGLGRARAGLGAGTTGVSLGFGVFPFAVAVLLAFFAPVLIRGTAAFAFRVRFAVSFLVPATFLASLFVVEAFLTATFWAAVFFAAALVAADFVAADFVAADFLPAAFVGDTFFAAPLVEELLVTGVMVGRPQPATPLTEVTSAVVGGSTRSRSLSRSPGGCLLPPRRAGIWSPVTAANRLLAP